MAVATKIDPYYRFCHQLNDLKLTRFRTQSFWVSNRVATSGRNSWVSLRHFAVNLTGGQPKMYWCLCCTGVSKWYEITCICHQAQGQHIQWTINSLWWLCLDLELTPRQIYDVIWNPRIQKPWVRDEITQALATYHGMRTFSSEQPLSAIWLD
jgi:hypothetical protein